MIKKPWGPLIFVAALIHPKHKYSSGLTLEEKDSGLEFIKKFKEETVETITDDDIESSKRDYLINHQYIEEQYDELQHFLLMTPPKECDLLSFWISQ